MRKLLIFTLKAKVYALDIKWDLKAKKQVLKQKENKMEDDGKDEDLEECGEMREECSDALGCVVV